MPLSLCGSTPLLWPLTSLSPSPPAPRSLARAAGFHRRRLGHPSARRPSPRLRRHQVPHRQHGQRPAANLRHQRHRHHDQQRHRRGHRLRWRPLPRRHLPHRPCHPSGRGGEEGGDGAEATIVADALDGGAADRGGDVVDDGDLLRLKAVLTMRNLMATQPGRRSARRRGARRRR